MTEKDAASCRDHLLSRSLIRELFQHNLVWPDGRIKDDPAAFHKYRSYLERARMERTTDLYKRRNNLVSEAENILKIRCPRPSEERRLKKILDQLELELTDDEIQVSKQPQKVSCRYLGSSEPKMSIHERKLLEEIERNKILKRDLTILDDWLEEISTPISTISKIQRVPSLTWKDFQKKHHTRVKKRMAEMDRARHEFIRIFSNFNLNAIRKLLAAQNSVERQRIYRSSRHLPVVAEVPKVAMSNTSTNVSVSSMQSQNVGKSTKRKTASEASVSIKRSEKTEEQ